MFRLRAFLIILLAVLFNGLASDARACTCIAPGPPCQAFWQSSAVFAGPVTNISTATVQTPQGGTYQQRVIRFVVEQAYRGLEGREADVFTGMHDAECGYGFAVGQRYLVYAHRSQTDGKLSTNICTRTRPLAEAEEDLKYIESVSRTESGARVFGTVKRHATELKDGSRALVPIKKVRVIIEGEGQRIRTSTNRQGEYQFMGLRPGRYTVRPLYPNEFNPASGYNLEVSDRGCMEANFVAEPVP